MKGLLPFVVAIVAGAALYAQAAPSPAGEWRLNAALTKEDSANWQHAVAPPAPRPPQPDQPFLGIPQPDFTHQERFDRVSCAASEIETLGCFPNSAPGVSAPPISYTLFSATVFQAEPDLVIRADKPAVLTIVEANGDVVSYQVGTTVSRKVSPGRQIKVKTSFASRSGSPFGAFVQEFTATGGVKATRTISGSLYGQTLFVDFHVASPTLKPMVEDIHRVYNRVN